MTLQTIIYETFKPLFNIPIFVFYYLFSRDKTILEFNKRKKTETTFHSLQFDTDEILVFMNEELRKNYLKIDRFDTLNNLNGSFEIQVNAQEIIKSFAVNNEIVVFTNDHVLEKRIDQLSVFVFDKTGKQTYSERQPPVTLCLHILPLDLLYGALGRPQPRRLSQRVEPEALSACLLHGLCRRRRRRHPAL